MILFFVFRLNILRSKVSNFAISFRAEGEGGFESYPASEISNKCIDDAFLMIYLSVLLLFFFPARHFKGRNQRFTKAVIL